MNYRQGSQPSLYAMAKRQRAKSVLWDMEHHECAVRISCNSVGVYFEKTQNTMIKKLTGLEIQTKKLLPLYQKELSGAIIDTLPVKKMAG